jgi:hypothetical protein
MRLCQRSACWLDLRSHDRWRHNGGMAYATNGGPRANGSERRNSLAPTSLAEAQQEEAQHRSKMLAQSQVSAGAAGVLQRHWYQQPDSTDLCGQWLAGLLPPSLRRPNAEVPKRSSAQRSVSFGTTVEQSVEDVDGWDRQRRGATSSVRNPLAAGPNVRPWASTSSGMMVV